MAPLRIGLSCRKLLAPQLERGMSVTSILSISATDVATARHGKVTLSRWVNEPLPPFHELLSAHDVARLTRRPKIIISGLVWLGRFPKRRRFRGRQIGWLRSDILDWLARDLVVDNSLRLDRRHCSRRHPRQACLPFEYVEPCIATRTLSGKKERN